MELPGKNAQEQVILERIEGAEIGVFRKQAGIIARQVHIDHIRTFHDLGFPGGVRGLAHPGHPLAGQFVDEGAFAGPRLPEQTDFDFMIPFPLPGLEELGCQMFVIPGHTAPSFMLPLPFRWPGST